MEIIWLHFVYVKHFLRFVSQQTVFGWIMISYRNFHVFSPHPLAAEGGGRSQLPWLEKMHLEPESRLIVI